MTHIFEFIVTKKQTEEEKAEGKEQEVLNLMYKTKSNRKAKVADMIRQELQDKEVMAGHEIEDFYLRQIK